MKDRKSLDLSNNSFQRGITVSNKKALDFLKNEFSIMFWVKGGIQGSKWGTLFYTSYSKGIAIHRQVDKDNLRIFIQNYEFTVKDFFNDDW